MRKLSSSLIVALFSATCLAAPPPLERFNSDLPEHGLVIGPDGYYLSRSSGPWGSGSSERILRFAADDGLPTEPPWRLAGASDSDFYYSPEQARGCFTRVREDDERDADLWCVGWDGAQWSEAVRLPAPVNSPATEFSPVLRPDGTLYFASDRPGGLGLGDLYRARLEGSEWVVEPLGPAVNSPGGEWNLEISPDGDVLLFEASHRATNRSRSGDLYIARRSNGGWSEAVPLSVVNSRNSELMPRYLGPDTVVYTASADDDADLRAVPAAALKFITPVVVAVARSAHEVVLLEPTTLTERARFAVGTGPHDVAASEDGRMAFVPSHGVFPAPHDEPIQPSEMRWVEQDGEGLAIVDLLTGDSETMTLPRECRRAHGAATTAQAERVWITCETAGEVLQIDTAGRTIEHRFEVPAGVHKVMYLNRHRLVVGSNPQAGAVHLIDVDDRTVETIETGKGAEALAAAHDQSRVYVANAFENEICTVDLLSRALGGCWPSGGSFPIALAEDAAERVLWIANNASSNLVALDLETGEHKRVIELPSRPLGMAFDARNRLLYAGLPRQNAIIAIDPATGEVVGRIDSVMEVDDIDLVPAAWFRDAPDT